MIKYLGFTFSLLLLFASCDKGPDLGALSFLDIESDTVLTKVFSKPEKYELQIRYVQIDRNDTEDIDLKTYEYRVDSNIYFYPASTVKMPVAFLALEKLNELYKKGHPVDFNTSLQIDAERPAQTPVIADSTAFDNQPSIGHYIHKLFIVSDNDAYNRLFEFVGPEEINNKLRAKDIFRNSRIVHRVGVSGFSPEENLYTNPFRFYEQERLVYQQEAKHMEPRSFEPLKGVMKGKGYIDQSGNLVEEPFDFSQKNFVSLRDLQESLMSVILKDGRFDLRAEDYDLLMRSMSIYPRESEAPIYNDKVETSGGRTEPYYYDGYVKFFMYGNSKEPIPDHIKIYNKVGFAYGYLTDCAYIQDTKNDIEFFLAATLHVNENEIYNDGIYEYDEVGLPFLDHLGDLFYQYELKRKALQD